jgi:hypothetical protein
MLCSVSYVLHWPRKARSASKLYVRLQNKRKRLLQLRDEAIAILQISLDKPTRQSYRESDETRLRSHALA